MCWRADRMWYKLPLCWILAHGSISAQSFGTESWKKASEADIDGLLNKLYTPAKPKRTLQRWREVTRAKTDLKTQKSMFSAPVYPSNPRFHSPSHRLSVRLSVRPCVRLSVRLCFPPSNRPSVHLTIRWSVRPSDRPTVRTCVCQHGESLDLLA
jgi:hypothetical protein